jgi:hypothetical protein
LRRGAKPAREIERLFDPVLERPDPLAAPDLRKQFLERHLTHAYQKLAVTSREQLVAALDTDDH